MPTYKLTYRGAAPHPDSIPAAVAIVLGLLENFYYADGSEAVVCTGYDTAEKQFARVWAREPGWELDEYARLADFPLIEGKRVVAASDFFEMSPETLAKAAETSLYEGFTNFKFQLGVTQSDLIGPLLARQLVRVALALCVRHAFGPCTVFATRVQPTSADSVEAEMWVKESENEPPMCIWQFDKLPRTGLTEEQFTAMMQEKGFLYFEEPTFTPKAPGAGAGWN